MKAKFHENLQPHKGPFWVTADKIIALPIATSVNPVPSHKEVWKSVKGKINKEWNYYPRGRIEIRSGKAIVFLNSFCYEYAQNETRMPVILTSTVYGQIQYRND